MLSVWSLKQLLYLNINSMMVLEIREMRMCMESSGKGTENIRAKIFLIAVRR